MDMSTSSPLASCWSLYEPEFFYSKPDMEYDLEVINRLYDCIRSLVPSKDV